MGWDCRGSESLHSVEIYETFGSDVEEVSIDFFTASLGLDAPGLLAWYMLAGLSSE
jgi:hypothetical protein